MPLQDELDAARQREAARQQHIDDVSGQIRIQAELDQAQREHESRVQLVTDVGHNAIDIPVQLFRGALEGLAEIPKAFADLSDVGPRFQLGSGYDVLNDTARDASRIANAGIDAVTEKPRTTVGGMANSVGRFLSAFLPAARVVKTTTLIGGITRTATAAGIAGAVALDPAEKNLDAIVQEHPSLANPVSEFLATNPNDAPAVNRMRNAIENAGLSAVADGLLAGIKVLRGARAAKAASAVEQEGRAEARTMKVPESPTVTPSVSPPAAPIATPMVDTVPTQAAHDVAEGLTTAPAPTAAPLADFNANTIDWSTFGDKADDVRNVIARVSESHAAQIDAAKGGVQPLHETARLAELVGGTTEGVSRLFADVRGDAGIAARVRGAEQVMLASASRVNTLAKAVQEAATPAEKASAFADLTVAVEQHAAIQAQVKGSKTEIARALHAMRALKQASVVDFNGLSKISDVLVDKLAANGASLADLNQAVRGASGRRWHDYAFEVWINGLLSGPATHVANFASNAIKAGMAIPERAVAAGIGRLRVALGQDVETVRAREVLSLAHGLVAGTVDAIKLPGATLLKAGGAVARWDIDAAKQLLIEQEAEFGTVYRALARGEPITDAATKLESIEPALHWDADAATGFARTAKQIGNGIGSLVRAPGAALQASDEMFKAIAYRQQLHALAMRTAMNEADALPAAAREAAIGERYAAILASPPEELRLAAQDFARYQTFTQSLGAAGRWVQQGLKLVPVLRFVIPFVRTPANILKNFAEYTPAPLVKLVTKQFRSQLAAGGAEADLMLSRMALGTAAMAGVWQLAEAGKIVGGGPKGHDSGELSGVQPYSVKVGDKWFGFNRLDPLGSLFGAVADLHEIIYRDYDANGSNAGIGDLAQLVAFAAAKNATSKTWLSGLSEFITAASDPERYGASYAQRVGSSLIPFSSALRAADAANDPMAHEVFTLADHLRARVPGMSADLPVKRDWLGRAVEHGRSWLSPVAVSEKSKDPVDIELSRLGFPVSMPDRSISGVPLTGRQYSRLLELRGSIRGDSGNLREVLAKTMQSSDYKALSDSADPSITSGTKAAAIKKVVGAFHSAATKSLLGEDQQLRDAWVAARRHRAGAQ